MNKLINYITQIRGITYRPEEISEYPTENYIPVLKANNITENGLDTSKLIFINKNRVKPEQYIKKGDILLVASSGSKDIVGRNIFFDSDYQGTFGAFCKIIRPNNIYPKYLYHFFQTPQYKRNIRKSIQGANINNLRNEHLDNLSIPILDLSNQIRVATLLSKVVELIVFRKKSIIFLHRLLQNSFMKMFGDPQNNYHKFRKDTIRAIVTDVKYGTSKPAEDDGKYPYLRMNNITKEGFWDFSDMKYINLKDSEKDKYLIKKGDLVFNRTNSKELVGKTAVFNKDIDMAIAGYLIRVRTNEEVNPFYLCGYLNSNHGKNTLYGLCRNIVGMANINAQELQDINILIPPIEHQNKYALIVEKVDSLKELYKSSLKELINLYCTLSQRAFNGELDLRKMEFQLSENSDKIEDNIPLKILITQNNYDEDFINSIPHSGAPDEIDHKLRLIDLELKTHGIISFRPEYIQYRVIKNKFTHSFNFSELMDELTKIPFDESFTYEKVKQTVFDFINGETPFLKQIFNKETQQIEYIINETA